jgi:hypothetical protein
VAGILQRHGDDAIGGLISFAAIPTKHGRDTGRHAQFNSLAAVLLGFLDSAN